MERSYSAVVGNSSSTVEKMWVESIVNALRISPFRIKNVLISPGLPPISITSKLTVEKQRIQNFQEFIFNFNCKKDARTCRKHFPEYSF